MKYALFLCRGLAASVFPSDVTKVPGLSLSGTGGALHPGTFGITRYSSANSTELSKIISAMLGLNDRNVFDPVFMTAYAGAAPGMEDVCIECTFAHIIPSEDGSGELVRLCDDISECEADELFSYLSEKMSGSVFEFVGTAFGCGYVIWKSGDTRGTGLEGLSYIAEPLEDVMPHGEFSAPFVSMVNRSRQLLSEAPVNIRRRQQGREEISALWFDSAGGVCPIPRFKDVFGISAALFCDDACSVGLSRMTDIEIVKQPTDSTADLMIFDIDISRISHDTDTAFSRVCGLAAELRAEKVMIAALPPYAAEDEPVLCPPMPFVFFDRAWGQPAETDHSFPLEAYRSGLFVPDAKRLIELLIT